MTRKFKKRWSTIPAISNIIMTRKFKQRWSTIPSISNIIMTRKFKHRWSTIPSISNSIMTRKFKQLMVNDSFNIYKTSNTHLKLLNIKMTMTNTDGNSGPVLRQAQICGEFKLVNEIQSPSDKWNQR